MSSNFVKSCVMYSNMIIVKIAVFLAVFSLSVNIISENNLGRLVSAI